jgi:hypothetical protein
VRVLECPDPEGTAPSDFLPRFPVADIDKIVPFRTGASSDERLESEENEFARSPAGAEGTECTGALGCFFLGLSRNSFKRVVGSGNDTVLALVDPGSEGSGETLEREDIESSLCVSSVPGKRLSTTLSEEGLVLREETGEFEKWDWSLERVDGLLVVLA